MKLADRGGPGEAGDGVHARRKRAGAGGAEPMAKEFDGALAEDAFFGVDDEATLFQERKNLAQVAAMELQAGTGDENVIQVDEGKGQVTEQRVHQALKSHARVLETKRHTDEHEKSERRDDCRLGNVSGGYWDLQVALLQVQFTENGTSVQASYQIGHVGQ